MGHGSAKTSLTYYVSVYADEPRQAVLDVERWIWSEAAGPCLTVDVITLEIRPDFRDTTEEEDEAA